MLTALFSWLDAHPTFYWSLALGVTAWCLFLALRNIVLSSSRSKETPWFAVSIAATVLAWRWPFLFAAHQLTPDEAQQVAGAITLAHDPVFWRSVDGATAGPLNFYVLLLPHLAGAPVDFFFARLTGLFLVAGSLVVLHRTLTREVGPAAGPATLAATLIFALTTDWEFIHYSTEHLPVFLSTVGAALWWTTRPGAPKHTLLGWAAAGFVAGLLPWAKLQAVPFAALFGGGALLSALNRSREAQSQAIKEFAFFSGGFVLPSLIMTAVVARTGVLSDFWFSYVARNFQYADQAWELSFVLSEFARLTIPLRIYPGFVLLCATFIAVGIVATVIRRRRPFPFLVATALFAATAILVVFSPRRGFPHYLLLSIIPLAAFAGAMFRSVVLDVSFTILRRTVMAAVLVVVAAMLAVRSTLPAPFMIGRLSDHWRKPVGQLAIRVRQLARPGDSIAVWGWMTEIYVHCQLPQAVRDAHSQRQIEPGPWRSYYRRRYIADFRKNRPAIFVDAVGKDAYAYQDRFAFGHRTFPELATLIRAEYVLVADEIHARLYVRHDRMGFPPVKP